jgi:hypothetical protein
MAPKPKKPTKLSNKIAYIKQTLSNLKYTKILLANNAKTRSNTRHKFYMGNPSGEKPRASIGYLHYDERVTT